MWDNHASTLRKSWHNNSMLDTRLHQNIRCWWLKYCTTYKVEHGGEALDKGTFGPLSTASYLTPVNEPNACWGTRIGRRLLAKPLRCCKKRVVETFHCSYNVCFGAENVQTLQNDLLKWLSNRFVLCRVLANCWHWYTLAVLSDVPLTFKKQAFTPVLTVTLFDFHVCLRICREVIFCPCISMLSKHNFVSKGLRAMRKMRSRNLLRNLTLSTDQPLKQSAALDRWAFQIGNSAR